MKNTIHSLIFAALAFVGAGALAVIPASSASAQNALEAACAADPNSPICTESRSTQVGDIVRVVVNILLFIVGVISVVMIIVGGIRYATSGGNASAVTAAKNTVLFAVIGLLIAFFAFAIVSWVYDAF